MTAAAGPVLRGTAASPGVASGPVFVASDAPVTATGRGPLPIGEAIEAAALRLEQLAAGRAAGGEGARILEAQAAMVRDPALRRAIDEQLAAGSPPMAAVERAAAGLAQQLARLDDPYLRARSEDVLEVGRMLVAEAGGAGGGRLRELRSPSVVLARELGPADTLSVDPRLLLGIATETGGTNSHAAIVARELGVPAVVGLAGLVAAAGAWAAVEIDGDRGELRPAASGRVRAAEASRERLDVSAAPLRVMANAGSREGALAAAARGAAGIGLFRTEFMFMAASGPMPEAEQAEVYAAACRAFGPHPVVIRTLDAGSDKPLPYLPARVEPNPALGRRGARLWLEREELWRPQVRALLRAALDCPNLKVMLPMVAAREEMVAARRHFAAEGRRLGAPMPELGMMVEVPAVAAALEAFAGVADFVSLGTNDLTQYAVAADRELDWDLDLGEYNPGVLRLISTAAETGARLKMPVGVCGEMAGTPQGAVFLAGAGVSSLSMSAEAMPAVVAALTRAGLEGCRRAAGRALAAPTAAGALKELRAALAEA